MFSLFFFFFLLSRFGNCTNQNFSRFLSIREFRSRTINLYRLKFEIQFKFPEGYPGRLTPEEARKSFDNDNNDENTSPDIDNVNNNKTAYLFSITEQFLLFLIQFVCIVESMLFPINYRPYPVMSIYLVIHSQFVTLINYMTDRLMHWIVSI